MGHRLLVIDTATTACSVALFNDNKLIANDYAEIGRGHAEKLVPMIDALPENGKADEILVNCGPGSFTGLRIGIAAAKALALAWKARLQGYQCLQLLAIQELAKTGNTEPVFVCMLAGHGEYFVQNYSASGIALDKLESLVPSAAIRKMQSVAIVGSGSTALAEAIEVKNQSKIALPNAVNAISLTDEQLIHTVAPIYVREPDAVKAKSL